MFKLNEEIDVIDSLSVNFMLSYFDRLILEDDDETVFHKQFMQHQFPIIHSAIDHRCLGQLDTEHRENWSLRHCHNHQYFSSSISVIAKLSVQGTYLTDQFS